jgi:hypothetical protein
VTVSVVTKAEAFTTWMRTLVLASDAFGSRSVKPGCPPPFTVGCAGPNPPTAPEVYVSPASKETWTENESVFPAGQFAGSKRQSYDACPAGGVSTPESVVPAGTVALLTWKITDIAYPPTIYGKAAAVMKS